MDHPLLVPAGNLIGIRAYEDLARLLNGGFVELDGQGGLIVRPSVTNRPTLPFLYQLRLSGLGKNHALLRTHGEKAAGLVLTRSEHAHSAWRTDGRLWWLPKGRTPLDLARELVAIGREAGPIYPLWTLPTSDPERYAEDLLPVFGDILAGFYALHNLTGLVQVSLPRVERTYAGPVWSPVGTKLPQPNRVDDAAREQLGRVLAHALALHGWPMERFAAKGGDAFQRQVFLPAAKAFVGPDALRSAHTRLPLIQRWLDAETAMLAATETITV